MIRETFKTPAGERTLAYLKSSFMAVLPATASDAELRYREGQRSVVGIIETRIKEAEDHGRNH